MRSARIPRFSGESFLESSRPKMRRRGFRMTAAANTGPNSEPRPASSRPAILSQPCWRAARSNREEQSRRIGADSNTAFHDRACVARKNCPGLLRFRFGRAGRLKYTVDAFDTRGLALEAAQVVKLGAAHTALLQNF